MDFKYEVYTGKGQRPECFFEHELELAEKTARKYGSEVKIMRRRVMACGERYSLMTKANTRA